MQHTIHGKAAHAGIGIRGNAARGLAAMAAMVLAAGCSRAVPATVSTTESLGDVVASPIAQTTTDEVANRLQSYVGRVVTMDAQVTRVFGPRWFAISNGTAGAKEVLVLAPSEAPALVSAALDSSAAVGTRVRVTGVVRAFGEDALEREVGGGLDLDGDVFDAFDASPVIVMTNLHATLPMTAAPTPTVRVDTVRVTMVPTTFITEITLPTTADLASLDNMPAALFGARVHQVFGPNAFTVHMRNPTGRTAAGGQAATSGDSLLLVVIEENAVRGEGMMTGAAATGAQAMSLRPGDFVAVVGVITPTTGADTTWRARAGMDASSADQAAIGSMQRYLSADRVERVRRASRRR